MNVNGNSLSLRERGRLTLLLLVAAATPSFAAFSDQFTPDERKLLDEVDQQHFIKARDDAEKILKTEPKSFPATWAMARVHHDEEGNHARALSWVRKAQTLLGSQDKEWGMKLLLEEHFLLAEMNRNEDALAVLDRYDAAFGPAPQYLRIWPMFKSGRSDEARQIALKLIAGDDEGDRADGFNGLLSIAFEEHDRDGTYKWSMAGVDAAPKNCTIVRNAGSACFTRFKLDEAEALSLKARKLKDCIDPVDNQIASLNIIFGQFQQAVSALESSRSAFIEKRYRPHFALVRRQVLVDLLEVVGQNDEALKLSTELYGQQQRMGASSSSPEVERLSRTIRLAYALDGAITREEERASFSSLPVGPTKHAAELSRLTARRWEIRHGLVQLLAGGDRLLLMTRPAMGEVSDWPSWRTADLLDVLGSGVMRASIAQARAIDAKFPESLPYFDALEGEIAWRTGRLDDALTMANRAIEKLPNKEAVLRWRVMAWRADLLRQKGRINEARADYQQVLQLWPTAFRILKLSIPVTVAGDAASKEAVDRVSRSTRFDVQSNAPFRIDVRTNGKRTDLCLLDSSGSQFNCAGGDDIDAALEAFHAAAFSPKVSLTQSDLKSLDGSPVRVGADKALKNLLEH